MKRVVIENQEMVDMIEDILRMEYIRDLGWTGADVVRRSVERYYIYRREQEHWIYTKRLNRGAIRARQAGRCGYCNKPTPVKQGTIDHMIPLERGGTSDLSNLIFCCLDCNQEKQTATAEEFRNMKLLERRMCPNCTK